MPKNILDDLKDIEKRTQEIEAEKAAKRHEREERKLLREHKKRQEAREKLVAPFFLLFTVIISYVLYVLYHSR